MDVLTFFNPVHKTMTTDYGLLSKCGGDDPTLTCNLAESYTEEHFDSDNGFNRFGGPTTSAEATLLGQYDHSQTQEIISPLTHRTDDQPQSAHPAHFGSLPTVHAFALCSDSMPASGRLLQPDAALSLSEGRKGFQALRT